MNPAELHQLVAALTEIAVILDTLGVPGLIGLAVSGPALVLSVILVVGFRRESKQDEKLSKLVETVRQEGDLYRQQTDNLIEILRKDMRTTVDVLGKNQSKTDQYYRDNVVLVKNYETLARDLQNVVVANTQAVTRLTVMLEAWRDHK